VVPVERAAAPVVPGVVRVQGVPMVVPAPAAPLVVPVVVGEVPALVDLVVGPAVVGVVPARVALAVVLIPVDPGVVRVPAVAVVVRAPEVPEVDPAPVGTMSPQADSMRLTTAVARNRLTIKTRRLKTRAKHPGTFKLPVPGMFLPAGSQARQRRKSLMMTQPRGKHPVKGTTTRSWRLSILVSLR